MLELLLVAAVSTSTPALTREEKYRQAALKNAAAYEVVKGDLDECRLNLVSVPDAPPSGSPIPAILYGIAGVGLGLVIGVAVGLSQE